MIQVDFKDHRPLYEQIKDNIKGLVISGIVKPDDKIPSVRDLAATLTINPNTIQKAYKDLEAEGIIYSVKGKGNFISTLDNSSVNVRRLELLQDMEKTIKELIYLDTPEQHISDFIKNIYNQKGVTK